MFNTPRDLIETALVATESELGILFGSLDAPLRNVAVLTFNHTLDAHEHDIKGALVDPKFVGSRLLTPNAAAKLEKAIVAAGGVRDRKGQLSPHEFSQQIAADRKRIQNYF